MNTGDYARFTEDLKSALEAHPKVRGLVALGSMSHRDYQPDQYSDHDFFVIVEPGTQEEFRTGLGWIPSADRIVLSYRETMHGLKVLMEGPHLLEFAVFDPDEVSLARVNRYRVLLDRCGLEARLAACRQATIEGSTRGARDDNFHAGQVATILYVGLCRHRRGEGLSGHHMVRDAVFYHLLPLLAKHLPSGQKALLDDLDVFRRFDLVFPSIAAELHGLLVQDVPSAAMGILELAERELGAAIPGFPRRGFDVVRQFAEDR